MKRTMVLALCGLLAAPAFAAYGLEWIGDGNTRRALVWPNPQAVSGRDLPFQPATYIFRVYPHNKACGSPDRCNGCPGCDNTYYTTFFWGNFGTFSWNGDTGSGSSTLLCRGGTNNNGACTIGGGQCTGGGVCCTSAATGSPFADTFYGFHPYPGCGGTSTPTWEVSAEAQDFLDHGSSTAEPSGLNCTSSCSAGCQPTWDRWYLQVMRVSSCTGTDTPQVGCSASGGTGRKLMEFYVDVPEPAGSNMHAHKFISRLSSATTYGNTLPPLPALTVGQTGCMYSAGGGIPVSWGGYPGYEEFSGIIRGIQIYNDDLSDADIAAEIASPMSTAAGQASIWYLNLNPRPSDVTDKRGNCNGGCVGDAAHDPVWEGTTAAEWTDGVSITPVNGLRPGTRLKPGARIR